ncbi:LysR family transcriptional regulator [Permianibacter sp. IMCC34836]|uniref:LysR family transcriptional regulator n=1 Tax=Permianibacter fluminis TaxID=2738515 RepID=UPI001557872F|nr:LysR family transcriptional regulator [Permianibacter fluminis]NQD36478.1 LysR family transcriptional regulator [Permianibacter fluminis]
MDEADLQLFLRIATLGSLSAAAREANLSPAVVSHRLGQLEQKLGVRLFHRSTRSLSLSEDGRLFLSHAEALVEAMTNARASFSAPGQLVQGVLRVTTSASFGRQHLTPLLAKFLALHPQLKIDLHLSDQVVDLIQEGFDVGIRMAEQIDPGLVARKLAISDRLPVAAPAYLARHGTPLQPADLAQHECLILNEQRQWKFVTGNGSELAVQVQGRLRCNHGESLREAALAGLGICIQSIWNIHRELASGALVPVLIDYPLANKSHIWAVYPSGRLLAPKVRAFIDFLLAEWKDVPWALVNSSAA